MEAAPLLLVFRSFPAYPSFINVFSALIVTLELTTFGTRTLGRCVILRYKFF